MDALNDTTPPNRNRFKGIANKVLRCASSLALAVTGISAPALPALLTHATAYADSGYVQRWDAGAMSERNQFLVSEQLESLTDANISTNNGQGGHLDVYADRTIDPYESEGDHPEYVIDMGKGFNNPSLATQMEVSALYRSCGVNPETGKTVDVRLTFSNFAMCNKSGFDEWFENTAKWTANEKGLTLRSDGWMPIWQQEDPYRACYAPFASVRLAANLPGGYWLLGIESCDVRVDFIDSATNAPIDMSNGYVTIDSLDEDDMLLGINDNNRKGNEMVGVRYGAFRGVKLLPDSLVGRWGDVTSPWTGNSYRTSFDDSNSEGVAYFYNQPGVQTDDNRDPNLQAMTMFGTTDRSGTFNFKMVDTASGTHNMIGFNTVGTVEPPAPAKYIMEYEGRNPTDYDKTHRYTLGEDVIYKVEQYIPSRDEMLGYYPYIEFTDDLDENLEIQDVWADVTFGDGSIAIIGGSNAGTSKTHAEYRIDSETDLGRLGGYSGNLYGNTVTFWVKAKVVDMPTKTEADGIYRIHNKGYVTFGATNYPGDRFSQETNKVTFELWPPVDPVAPTKYVIGEGGDRIPGEDMSKRYQLGDTVTYEIDRQIEDLISGDKGKYLWLVGEDGHSYLELGAYYDYIYFTDTLDYGQTPKRIWATAKKDGVVTNVSGTEFISGQDIAFRITDKSYLGNPDGSLYGSTVTLHIECEVTDYPLTGSVYSGEQDSGWNDNSLLKFYNTAHVVMHSSTGHGSYDEDTNETLVHLIPPVLTIEKHSALNEPGSRAIDDYQYLVRDDEGNPYSLVHFDAHMSNIESGTKAKEVTIRDILPRGLKLVQGSVNVTLGDERWNKDSIVTTYGIDDSNNVLTITLPDLEADMPVYFSYDCTTTDEANGEEVVNTAKAWAINVPFDANNEHNGYFEEGREDRAAKDDGEIYINDPNIVITKAVDESPIQNADYQRGEEYRVGDDFTYTVTITNDVPGTYAKDVWITDDEMPAAFEQVGDMHVFGLDYNNIKKAYIEPVEGSTQITHYPYTGSTGLGTNSDTVHNETKNVVSNYSFHRQDNTSDDTWGWALHLDYLPYGNAITIKWTVRPTWEANGWEVYNQAVGTAWNQPLDTFKSNEPIVWVNTPEFDIEKYVTKSNDAYSVGSHAEYEVVLNGLKTPGTLARQTYLADVIETQGIEINESARFGVYDQRRNTSNMSDRVNLYACESKTAHVGFDEDTARLILVDDEGHVVCDNAGKVIYLSDQLMPDRYMAEDTNSYIENVSVNTLLRWLSTRESLDLTQAEAEDNAVRMYVWHNGERLRYDDGSDQSWHIDMAQAYGDDNGYWVNDYPFRYVWRHGELARIDRERNPVGADGRSDANGRGEYSLVWDRQTHNVTGYSYMRVEYETTINDHALENEMMHNEATANSIENRPVTDEAAITVIGAQLDIIKDSTDGGHFNAGDIAEYELTIRNNATDTTATDVQIKDAFTTAKAGAVEIVDGSIKLYDNNMNPISGFEVEYRDNEAGNHIGFTIDTNHDLNSNQKLTVRYEVKYLTDNGSDVIRNTACTWASNAPEVSDTYETWPSDADQTKLTIDKGSDKQRYTPDEVGKYTLHITNATDETVYNVTIKDQIDESDTAYAHVVNGSVRLFGADSVPIGAKVMYTQTTSGEYSGFYIETGYDLEPGEYIDVEYEVRFGAIDSTAGQVANIHNSAWAAGDNSGKATDDNEVIVTDNPDSPDDLDMLDKPDDPDGPEPSSGATITKNAAPAVVDANGEVTYIIRIVAGDDGLINASVIDVPDGRISINEQSIKVIAGDRRIENPYSRVYFDTQGMIRPADEVDDADADSFTAAYEFILGDMDAAEEAYITYTAAVPSDAIPGDEYVNTATLRAENINPIHDNAAVSVDGGSAEYGKGTKSDFNKTGDDMLMTVICICSLSMILLLAISLAWRRKMRSLYDEEVVESGM